MVSATGSVPVGVSMVPKIPTELVTQVTQPMSPAADKVIGLVAETATVPLAFGKVITLDPVGSVALRTRSLVSAVAPSNSMRLSKPLQTLRAVSVTVASGLVTLSMFRP